MFYFFIFPGGRGCAHIAKFIFANLQIRKHRFVVSLFFLRKNPVNPNEYLRGSVYRVYPQWQAMRGLREKNFSQPLGQQEYDLHDGGSLRIFSWEQSEEQKEKYERPLHCVFQIEKNRENEYFFIDFCANMEHSWIVSFYESLRRNLPLLPAGFSQPDRSHFFLSEKNIPFVLPNGFLSLTQQEGRLYFVDTAGIVHGEAYSQALVLSQGRALAHQRKLDKIFTEQERWHMQEHINFAEKNIYCSLFFLNRTQEKSSNDNQKLACFFYAQRSGEKKNSSLAVKGSWFFWIFHYRKNYVHQEDFVKKIVQDFELMQNNFADFFLRSENTDVSIN